MQGGVAGSESATQLLLQKEKAEREEKMKKKQENKM